MQSRILRFLVTCLATWLLWTHLLAGEQEDRVQSPEEAQRTYQSITSQFRLVPYLPDPIGKHDVQAYAEKLGLSTPQLVFLDFLYGKYLIELGDIAETDIRVLLHHSELIDAWQSVKPTWNYLSDYDAYLAQRDKVISRIVDADELMFSALSGVLHVDQTEVLKRVRMHRQRSRWLQLDFRVFAARVDLSRVAEALDFERTMMNSIDGVMHEYEVVVTPKFQHLGETVSKRLQAIEVAKVEMWTTVISDEEYFLQCTNALAESARLQSEIRRLNETYLDRIVAAIDEEDGSLLKKAYFDLAYGPYFPDRSDPEPLFDRMVNLPSVENEHRSMLEVIWSTYRREYDSVSDKLYGAFEHYQEEFSKTNRSSSWMPSKHEARELARKRVNLNRAVVARLRDALPPEARVEMERDIDRFLAKSGR